jgi:hypothetical protein
VEENSNKQNELLKQLPKSLHAFISIEVFIDFIMRIPYLRPFVDTKPLMVRSICQVIEKITIGANNLLFGEGLDGIYYIEEGIVTMDGKVFPSGSIVGLTCIRDNIKLTECKALIGVKATFLPRSKLLEILHQHPKVQYYCKRWVHWQLVRDYIFAYKNLYYTAARRGALMNPPLTSKRPSMSEKDRDDIDLAVLDHINENGY